MATTEGVIHDWNVLCQFPFIRDWLEKANQAAVKDAINLSSTNALIDAQFQPINDINSASFDDTKSLLSSPECNKNLTKRFTGPPSSNLGATNGQLSSNLTKCERMNGIANPIKEIIREYMALDVKPAQISRYIEAKGFTPPERKQLHNFIQYERRKMKACEMASGCFSFDGYGLGQGDASDLDQPINFKLAPICENSSTSISHISRENMGVLPAGVIAPTPLKIVSRGNSLNSATSGSSNDGSPTGRSINSDHPELKTSSLPANRDISVSTQENDLTSDEEWDEENGTSPTRKHGRWGDTENSELQPETFPLQCAWCRRGFRNQRAFGGHRTLHSKAGTGHKCDLCGFLFRSEEHLRLHLRSHSSGSSALRFRGGTNSAFCDVQNGSSKLSPQLNSNVALSDDRNNQHSGSKEQPFSCTASVHQNRASPKQPASQQQAHSILFICPHCAKSDFSSPAALQLHMLTEHSATSKSATPLNSSQLTAESLQSRLKKSPPNSNDGSPGINDSVLNADIQFAHLAARVDATIEGGIHSSKMDRCVNCGLCGQILPDISHLQRHTLERHSIQEVLPFSSKGSGANDLSPPPLNDDLPYACDYCPARFDSILSLHGHMNACEYAKNKKTFSMNGFGPGDESRDPKQEIADDIRGLRSRSSSNSRSLNQEASRTCDICGRSFGDSAGLLMHVHHEHPANGSQNHYRASPAVPPRKPTPKYACEHCGITYHSSQLLNNHVITHYLQKESHFSCKSCSKTFGVPDDLQKHLLELHAVQLYRCSLCKEVFDSRVDIQVHFAVTHSHEVVQFRCKFCIKSASADMNNRQLASASESIYETESELKAHVQAVHLQRSVNNSIPKPPTSNGLPMKCLPCNETFANEFKLFEHSKLHRVFDCPFCTESFNVEYLYERHVETYHSGGVMSIHPFRAPSVSSAHQLAVQNLQLSTRALLSPFEAGNLTKSGSRKTSDHKSPIRTSCTNLSVDCFKPSLIARGSQGGAPTISGGAASLIQMAPQKCNICDLSCESPIELAEHKLQHCKVIVSDTCAICREPVMNLAEFYAHTTSHNAQPGTMPVTCVICRQSLASHAEIDVHAKFHLNAALNGGNRPASANGDSYNNMFVLGAETPSISSHQRVVMKFDNLNLHNSTLNVGSSSNLTSTNRACGLCASILTPEDIHLQLTGVLGVDRCSKCSGQPQRPSSSIPSLLDNYRFMEYKSSRFGISIKQQCGSPKDARLDFTCNECPITAELSEKSFGSDSDLQEHIRLRHRKDYQCIKCQASFATEAEIQAHVATHVLQDGINHHCMLCGEIFDSPSKLQCHLIEHSFVGQAEYNCYLCGSIFTMASSLQQHMLKHNFEERPYDCTHAGCSQRFFFRFELENHSYAHSRSTADVDICDSSQFGSKGEGGISASVGFLTASLKPHSTVMSPALTVPITPATSPAPSSASFSNLFRCVYCEDPFVNRDQLANHELTCSQATNRRNDSCRETNGSGSSQRGNAFVASRNGKAFPRASSSTASNLSNSSPASAANLMHARIPGSEPPIYACPHCSKVFGSISALQGHSHVHMTTRGGTHLCAKCDKTFSSAAKLRNHQRQHNGDKPYPCDICGRPFSRKDNLKVHMKTHFKSASLGSASPFDEESLPTMVNPANGAVGMAACSPSNSCWDSMAASFDDSSPGEEPEDEGEEGEMEDNLLEDDCEQLEERGDHAHEGDVINKQICQEDADHESCTRPPLEAKHINQFCNNDNQEKNASNSVLDEYLNKVNEDSDEPPSKRERLDGETEVSEEKKT